MNRSWLARSVVVIAGVYLIVTLGEDFWIRYDDNFPGLGFPP